MSATRPSLSILFVCLGNICRSPMAEGAMRVAVVDAGLELGVDITLDSAGTGAWHVGNPPDPRSQGECLAHGVDISDLRARQVVEDDFMRFTHIFAMDSQNLADLCELTPPNSTAKISLLLDEVEGLSGKNVPDPYYGSKDGFAQNWQAVSMATRAILARI